MGLETCAPCHNYHRHFGPLIEVVVLVLLLMLMMMLTLFT